MRKLYAETRGSAAVEFAIVAPVLLLLIGGGLELGYLAYVKTVLEGEMQRASRDRTLETAATAEARTMLEDRVRRTVRNVAPTATIDFERVAYRDYRDAAGEAEPFNDANGNEVCDANEAYLDINRNGHWDRQTGVGGSDGEAKDVVVYVATVDYKLLPFGHLLHWGPFGNVTARTALRNQPFDQQASVVERSCAP